MPLNDMYDQMEYPVPYSKISEINLLNSSIPWLRANLIVQKSWRLGVAKSQYGTQICYPEARVHKAIQWIQNCHGVIIQIIHGASISYLGFISDRDLLWAKLLNLEKCVVCLDKQSQCTQIPSNPFSHPPIAKTNGFNENPQVISSLSDLDGNTILANSQSLN